MTTVVMISPQGVCFWLTIDLGFLAAGLGAPVLGAPVLEAPAFLAALQGLANREAPQLYVIYCNGFGVETDQFWLDWLRGEDGWLKSGAPFR